MIVKGTKQLGSFKRGINLYVPSKTLKQENVEPCSILTVNATNTSVNGQYILFSTTNGYGLYYNSNQSIKINVLNNNTTWQISIANNSLPPYYYKSYGGTSNTAPTCLGGETLNGVFFAGTATITSN